MIERHSKHTEVDKNGKKRWYIEAGVEPNKPPLLSAAIYTAMGRVEFPLRWVLSTGL